MSSNDKQHKDNSNSAPQITIIEKKAKYPQSICEKKQSAPKRNGRIQWSKAADERAKEYHEKACNMITDKFISILDPKQQKEVVVTVDNNGEPQFSLEPKNEKKITCFCFTR